MARVRPPHRAGLRRPRRAVPDQQVRLRLAVELVQPRAQPLGAPRRRLLADHLAAARERAQRQGRAVVRGHHPQRRRGHEDVAHAEPRDQVERQLGIELRRLEREHGAAVVEAGHEHVEEAAHPGPVRGRPDQVVRLREEVVRELEPRQVAVQDAVREERALRRPGRARGVDDQRRRVGRCRHRLEAVGRGREQRRQLAVDVDRLHALELAVGEHDRRIRVAEPHRHRVRAEAGRERNSDRAQLVDRDVRDRRLGPLRQRDPDAISLADPPRPQRVREPVRVVGELAERDAPGDLAPVRDHDRDRVARVALADVDAQVHLRRHLPAEAPVQLLVRHAQRRSSSAR